MTPCVVTKPGVQFDRIAPGGFKILAALQAASFIFDRDVVITCGTESHPATDPHARGEAFDVRAAGMSDATVLAFVDYLNRQLGPAFTVLYETPSKPSGVLASVAYVNAGASAPHFHVQVRKGTNYPENASHA